MSRMNSRIRWELFRRHKRKLLTLQGGMLISAMIVSGSQLTGSTYSDFSTVEDQLWSLSACEVFPSQIASKMIHIVSMLEEADEARQAIAAISVDPGVDPEAKSYEKWAVEDLSAYAEALAEQISRIELELAAIRAQLASNASLRAQVADAMGSAVAEMNQLHNQVDSLPTECFGPGQAGELEFLTASVLHNVSVIDASDSKGLNIAQQYEQALIHLQQTLLHVQEAMAASDRIEAEPEEAMDGASSEVAEEATEKVTEKASEDAVEEITEEITEDIAEEATEEEAEANEEAIEESEAKKAEQVKEVEQAEQVKEVTTVTEAAETTETLEQRDEQHDEKVEEQDHVQDETHANKQNDHVAEAHETQHVQSEDQSENQAEEESPDKSRSGSA